MGRSSWSDRSTVEESKALDISWLKRNDFLCGYRTGTITWKMCENSTGSIGIRVEVRNEPEPEGTIRMHYAITDYATGEKANFDYTVMLVTTRCNYGKHRWWFRCPVVGCCRRVGKLYLPPGAKYFGCRHCHSLTYESCRESHGWAYRFAEAHGATLGQMKKALSD